MLGTCLLDQANVFCLTSLDLSTGLLVGPLEHWFIIPCFLVFWFDYCFFGFIARKLFFFLVGQIYFPVMPLFCSV